MENYSTIKEQVLIHAKMQIKLKNLMLSTRSQMQKVTHCMIQFYMKVPQHGNPKRQNVDRCLPDAAGWRRGMESSYVMRMGFVWGDENVLRLDNQKEVMVAPYCDCSEYHRIVP